MIHTQLWPAILGAAIVLPLLGVAMVALARAWTKLSPRRRWVLLGALAIVELAYWVNVYAWLIEPNRLEVRRVTIESAQWHGPPLTIAAIGDVHLDGPHMNTARLERIVRRTNGLRPDLVVLLGDYVAGHAPKAERSPQEQARIESGLGVLAALTPPLGVVAVIGNHDVWYDRTAVTRALQDAGVAVLWDRHVAIQHRDHAFVVAGLADPVTNGGDIAAALDGAPEGEDVIVATHSPDPFANGAHGAALTLAAHTHGGQVWLPFVGRPLVPSAFGERYARGVIVENGAPLFVTSGLGTSVLPLRFMTPPEIALITLCAPGNCTPAQRNEEPRETPEAPPQLSG